MSKKDGEPKTWVDLVQEILEKKRAVSDGFDLLEGCFDTPRGTTVFTTHFAGLFVEVRRRFKELEVLAKEYIEKTHEELGKSHERIGKHLAELNED